MYSFEPDEEQKMLVDAVNKFAINDLRARASENDEEGHLPPFLVEKGWELGFLQASIPEQYGGFGERSAVTGVLAAEEMAYGDLAGALAVMTPGSFAIPVLLVGSEQQKLKYLPAIAEAQWSPYTAGIIEPYFDFDTLELRTTAFEEDDHFVITGEKMYVPYAADAEALIIYARLAGNTQGFIIHRDDEGLEVGEREKTLGLYALPTYRVRLNGVRVLKSNRLGASRVTIFHQSSMPCGLPWQPCLWVFHALHSNMPAITPKSAKSLK